MMSTRHCKHLLISSIGLRMKTIISNYDGTYNNVEKKQPIFQRLFVLEIMYIFVEQTLRYVQFKFAIIIAGLIAHSLLSDKDENF